MSPQRQRLIRLLFDEYIAMYAARDARLITRFSENFSGFSSSGDQLVKSRSEWADVMRRDFDQVPGRLTVDVIDVFPQDLGKDVVAATGLFHIHLPLPDGSGLSVRETARKVLVFQRAAEGANEDIDGGDWKIVHVSMSMPFGAARPGEVFPVDSLKERHRVLEALVEERTQALEQANRQLQLLSSTDGLTGIANRRHFDAALAHEWARAQRARSSLALIMLDVDLFKHFNDHYGHLAGDACLQTLAVTLAQMGARREGDLAARFGGEEFVVLLPETDTPAAMGVAQQIQQALQALALPHEGVPLGVVTVSFGVASVVPHRDQAPEELLRRADRAMYRAKQAGRNRIEAATD